MPSLTYMLMEPQPEFLCAFTGSEIRFERDAANEADPNFYLWVRPHNRGWFAAGCDVFGNTHKLTPPSPNARPVRADQVTEEEARAVGGPGVWLWLVESEDSEVPRYARSVGKDVLLVKPDGTVRLMNG